MSNAALFETVRLRRQLGSRWIYDDFTVRLPNAGLTGIIGPNGCGKSTLLRMLAGLAQPDGGQILMRGRDLASIPLWERARQMAYLPQTYPALPEMTVTALVAKGRTPWRHAFLPMTDKDRTAISRAIAATGLDGLEHRRLGSLSGGQRQRVWLAMALAQETPVILLDEPTSYLDLPHQLTLLHLLRRMVDEEGRTIVMVIHDLTLAARFCDHLIGLASGKLVTEGAPEEALTAETIWALFGLAAEIQPDPIFGRPVVYPLS